MPANFYISAHGREIGTFELPSNIRVITKCTATAMTACSQNELRLWRTVMGGIGEDLTELIDKYEQYKIHNEDRSSLCIFSPNHNIAKVSHDLGMIRENDVDPVQKLFDERKCPNFILNNDFTDFRTGIYNLPAKFMRVYHSNYMSTTGTKDFKKAGTIEPININELERHNIGLKITDAAMPLNRLEYLLIKPTPIIKQRAAVSVPAMISNGINFLKENSKESEDARKYFSNVMSMHSFIIPAEDSFQAIREGIQFRDIVEKISRENPDTICNIVLATCRNQTASPFFPAIGVPLKTYLEPIFNRNKNNNQKYTEDLNKIGEDAKYDTQYKLYETYDGDKYIPDLTYQQWDQYIFMKYITNRHRQNHHQKYIKYKQKYIKYKQKYN